jgi:hypothetical protein
MEALPLPASSGLPSHSKQAIGLKPKQSSCKARIEEKSRKKRKGRKRKGNKD